MQFPELTVLWDYRKKQKKKCKSLAALRRVTDAEDAATLFEDQTVKEDATPRRVRNASVEMSRWSAIRTGILLSRSNVQ